jgi:hypothetical protein
MKTDLLAASQDLKEHHRSEARAEIREPLREEGCDNLTLAKHMECSLINADASSFIQT